MKGGQHYKVCLHDGRELGVDDTNLDDMKIVVRPANSGARFYIKEDAWVTETSITLYVAGRFGELCVSRQKEYWQALYESANRQPCAVKDVYAKSSEKSTFLGMGDGKGVEVQESTDDGKWVIRADCLHGCWLECSFVLLPRHRRD